jgi:cell division transport system permease protein
MRLFKNTGYYFSEVISILRHSGLSGVLSLISMALMCFVLMLTVGGWMAAAQWVDFLNSEAEISAYYTQDLNAYSAETLIATIEEIPGVTAVSAVSKEEADAAMREILGDSAEILNYFDETPIQAYLEIHVDLEQRTAVAEAIRRLDHIDYVRDNADLLDRLERLNQVIQLIGAVVGAAVLVTGFIITAHITREGIESNRKAIETFFLLGAPKQFVFRPYLWNGVLLSATAAGLASIGYVLMSGVLTTALLDVMPFAGTTPGGGQNVWAPVILFAAATGWIAAAMTLNRIEKSVRQ